MSQTTVQSLKFSNRNRNEQTTKLPNPSCAEIVNLIKKGDKLVPFTGFGIKESGLSQNDKTLYIHYCDTYENFIVYENGYFAYKNSLSTVLRAFKISSSVNFSIAVDVDSVVITHVGNILILTDTVNLANYYFLFNTTTGDYGYMFEMPECANIQPEGKQITVNAVTVLDSSITNADTNPYHKAILSDDTPINIAVALYNKASFTTQTAAQNDYLSWLQEIINFERGKGRIKGFALFRVAYRLYDNSFVCPSMPKLVYTGSGLRGSTYYNAIPDIDIDSTIVGPETPTPLSHWYRFTIDEMTPSSFQAIITFPATIPDIVKSVCIFSSIPLDSYSYNANADNTTVTAEFKSNLGKIKDGTYLKEANYYLVEEIPVAQLSTWSTLQDINLGDINTMPSRERLVVNANTTHRYFPTKYLNYNSRLFACGITTELTNQFGINSNSEYYAGSEYAFQLAVKLNTGLGTKYVISPLFYKLTNALEDTAMILGYPDSRAVEMYLLKDGDIVKTFSLVPHPTEDFAYHDNSLYYITVDGTSEKVDDHFRLSFPDYWSVGTASTMPSEDNTILDINRIIASELNNPFKFPFKNSYQVGYGAINHIDVQTLVVSQGQFGQYPIVVFSESGLYMLDISTNEDVVISSIHMVSNVRIEPNTNILNVDGKLFFMTNKGLCYIAGGEVVPYLQELMPILATNTIPIGKDANYIVFVKNAQTVDLLDSTFENEDVFVPSAEHTIGYSSYYHCIILDDVMMFADGYTCKLTNVLTKQFVFNGKYYAICNSDNSTIYDLSLKETTYLNYHKEVAIITNPISFESFQKVTKSILRCNVINPTSSVSGLYLYGSADGNTWSLLAGNQILGSFSELSLPRIPTSVKYIIIIFAGRLDEKSEIDRLDMQLEECNNLKLR